MRPRATNLLKDLRAAIVRALSGSGEVRSLFDQVRDEGYSLYFVVHRKPLDEEGSSETAPIEGLEATPVFRIDGRDLSILKSLGIDPTRSTRKRKSN